MSTCSTVAINPPLLAWALAESGHTLERVAKGIDVKEERIKDWLEATRQPTMRQVENLAHFFQRPFSIFFLPAPPKLPLIERGESALAWDGEADAMVCRASAPGTGVG